MDDTTAATVDVAPPPPAIYPEVLRLLGELDSHQLHSLRMYAIPAEQKRRRGIVPVLPAKEEK